MPKNKINYWDKKWRDRAKMPVNNFAKRCFSFIKNKRLKTLLDLGCGLGGDALYFAKKGFSVIALDVSKVATCRLRELNPKLKCITGDIRDIPLKDNSFDVIYAHLSLHYFDDKTTTEVFNKLHRVLKKNGFIFIKCKSTDDPLCGQGEKVGENMYKKKHIRHFFNKEYMQEKLIKFKIIKIRKTASVYNAYKSSFIEAIATKI